MTWTIREGHALDLLQAMPDASVQMCATSPPYWNLRDYGDGGQEWPEVVYAPMPGLPTLTIPASVEPLGLESDPWAYVGHLVAIFREVRRVLRGDGVLFLNLGDSYNSNPSNQHSANVRANGSKALGRRQVRDAPALKPKDLVGIPWRAAYALQADGWYLRSDVIWAKPNPMPESVRDRPTKAHEYVFLMSKGPRYFWDQEAVREAPSGNSHGGGRAHAGRYQEASGRNDGNPAMGIITTSRNLRTVWTIATQPYPGLHFAVWPAALAERCIKAGSSEYGACGECGAPWVRVVERSASTPGRPNDSLAHPGQRRNDGGRAGGFVDMRADFKGWQPTCTCNAARVPCTVLDPFSGAGTTLLTAAKLGRDAIGLEQSAAYAQQARERIVRDLGASAETLEAMGDNAPTGAQVGLF